MSPHSTPATATDATSLLVEAIASRPLGATTEELCRSLLRASQGTIDRARVLMALTKLRHLDLVRFGHDRRWRHTAGPQRRPEWKPGTAGERSLRSDPEVTTRLYAIAGGISGVVPSRDNADGPAAAAGWGADGSLPERLLPRLLEYYASALSADQRPAASFLSSHHGRTFILCASDRPIQPREDDALNTFSIPLGELPDGIKEILARRGQGSVFLGYPIAVFRQASVADGAETIDFIRPAGILNCRWSMDERAWHICHSHFVGCDQAEDACAVRVPRSVSHLTNVLTSASQTARRTAPPLDLQHQLKHLKVLHRPPMSLGNKTEDSKRRS